MLVGSRQQSIRHPAVYVESHLDGIRHLKPLYSFLLPCWQCRSELNVLSLKDLERDCNHDILASDDCAMDALHQCLALGEIDGSHGPRSKDTGTTLLAQMVCQGRQGPVQYQIFLTYETAE